MYHHIDTDAMQHITVLQQEAVTALDLTRDSVVVDCTLGSGGHAREIIACLGPKGTYIGIDADPTAIAANKDLQSSGKAQVILIEGNFRDITELLHNHNITSVDAILADLGWRTEQFDGSSGLPRGFSFKVNEPLLMTFGTPEDQPLTAQDIVNEWGEEDIANVIFGYGEEQFSRRIAKAIVEKRSHEPITGSAELAQIVYDAVPVFYRRKKIHPATKTFQALRIAVNDEFNALSELIADGFELLNTSGRMAIISFHSLEDRIVKHTFKELVHDQNGVLVTKKPIEASAEELHDNPRSRSAKLRIIEKTA